MVELTTYIFYVNMFKSQNFIIETNKKAHKCEYSHPPIAATYN